ncbi:hypothetical protein J7K25_01760, partial [bacterium]|nr:hypothetical protein [bacterium]
LFFTESDIVCYFYSILCQNLGSNIYAKDKDGHNHSLIHREYPTPFRCDMSNGRFEIKDDEERTKKGGKYQRGHYDMIILNPNFIYKYSYEVIKAQDYELYKSEVFSESNNVSPVILYGLEFMYRRDPLTEKQIKYFVRKVIQDADKLKKTQEYDNRFMKEIKMLTFVKGSPEKICNLLSEKLSDRKEIILCFAD